MRRNHKWQQVRIWYLRAVPALGALTMLALALGAGEKWR